MGQQAMTIIHTYPPYPPDPIILRRAQIAAKRAAVQRSRFQRTLNLLNLIIDRYERDHDTFKVEWGCAVSARHMVQMALQQQHTPDVTLS